MQLCLNYQFAWWEDIQVYKEFHQNKLSWVVRLKRWQARYSQVNVNTSGCKNRTQGWVLGSQSQSQLYGDRSSDEGMNGPIAVGGNSQWRANTNGEACLWFTCIWIECFIDIMLQMNRINDTLSLNCCKWTLKRLLLLSEDAFQWNNVAFFSCGPAVDATTTDHWLTAMAEARMLQSRRAY